jgi:hypothetical protein
MKEDRFKASTGRHTMTDIASLTTGVWTMIQPYLPILATKAAEEIGTKVPEAVGKVWDAISKKFETKSAANEALADVLKAPDDSDTQAAFRQQLKKIMAEDTSFAIDLSKLLEAAGGTYRASLTGSGAIAQGTGAKAVGQGGVMIGGDVTGNFVMGDENTVNSDKKKKK